MGSGRERGYPSLDSSRQGIHDAEASWDVLLRDRDIEAALGPRSTDNARVIGFRGFENDARTVNQGMRVS